MNADERPLSAVPAWLWTLLLAMFVAQLAVTLRLPAPSALAVALPPAPSAAALRAASLGETPATARLAMLYLQAFDQGSGNMLSYRQLDFGRLADWLRTILAVDPRSHYPLFAAARIYAEAGDAGRTRVMLEFVHGAFLEDPNRRWPALAHAALLAKHRLRDLPLALRYAADLQRLVDDPDMPLWARQMEIFILEDMDELEAAKVMLGGLLESGRLQDPAERRFLQQRLEELDRRLSSKP